MAQDHIGAHVVTALAPTATQSVGNQRRLSLSDLRAKKRTRLSLDAPGGAGGLQENAPDLLEFLADRNDEVKLLQRQLAEARADRQKLQKDLEDSRESLRDQKGRASTLEAERDAVVGEGKRLRKELEAELKREMGRTSTLNAELQEADAKQAKSRAAAKAAEAKMRAMEEGVGRKLTASAESEMIIGNLREEIRAMEAEVHEARRLKAHVRNVDMLREQLHAEERRAARAESSLITMSELQDHVGELEGQLASWKAVSAEADSPQGLSQLLSQLQAQALALKEESYKQEAEGAGSKAGAGPSESLQLETLQSENAQMREHLTKLELELTEQKASAVELSGKLTVRAEKAEGKVKRLEAEADSLASQVAELQERVGKGEYNPETTRVVHMIHNPETEAHAQAQADKIAGLEAHNAALQQELQKLEEASGTGRGEGGNDAAVARSVAVLEAQGALLQLKVNDLEKRNKRLTEVFTKQVAAFREACFRLFGYRLDMNMQPGGHVSIITLKPQHASRKSEELVFQQKGGAEGSLELVGNEYVSRKLAKEAETYIHRFKSIPAFTANLTMELFNSQSAA
ncbi:hypothetical protein WJX73_003823 [Symbiochloris irregularis]|uniref:Mitotic spindle assembly checkpoint protein MAD1 n=1 Tax=Symbiochloris irregularis TaxID=706552 RepID=A0AAW1P1P6_9CHLO